MRVAFPAAMASPATTTATAATTAMTATTTAATTPPPTTPQHCSAAHQPLQILPSSHPPAQPSANYGRVIAPA